MSYEVKPGNIFGRLGTGIGKGIAEQAPKEIERLRLQSGLKDVSQKKDLTPFQQFAELSGVPGVTPQMIESGSKLLRQQGVNQALMQGGQNRAEEFLKAVPQPEKKPEGTPTLESRSGLEATLEPYIPKSLEQIQQRAGELLRQNPALYAQDPDKALAAAQQEDQIAQSQSLALQNKRNLQQGVQTNIRNTLAKQNQNLGSKNVPGNLYDSIEDKAINAVLPVEQGGEGLTELQAIKKYGKELQDADRDYSALDAIGKWSMLSRSPAENQRNIRSIRQGFKDRNDLENFADTLIGDNGITPANAYSLAYPVSEIKDLKSSIDRLPTVRERVLQEQNVPIQQIQNVPFQAIEDLSKKLGKNGSPLAVAEALSKKGYSPDAWLDYLDKNRRQLDLTERQVRELGKPRSFYPSLSDLWLFKIGGAGE